jgi:hypothetical protein
VWDDNGYPTAEDDDFLAYAGLPLDFQRAAEFILTELPRAAEHCCAWCGVTDAVDFMDHPVKRIEFSTGGWSGAESLIGFIESRFDTRHFMESWRRGGHYVFEIPRRAYFASSGEAFGRDGETRLDAKHEHAVPNEDSADAQPTPPKGSN